MSKCVQLLTDLGIGTLSEVLDPTALTEHLRGVWQEKTKAMLGEGLRILEGEAA